MLNKWFLLSISCAAFALTGTAIAAPKSAVPNKANVPSRSWLRQGPARSYPRSTPLSSSVPNMTKMPKSHIVAGLQSSPFGPAYTDTQGKVIGRMNRLTGRLVWLDGKPTRASHSR